MREDKLGLIVQKSQRSIFVSRRVQGVSGLLLAILAHGRDLRGASVSCDCVTEPMARLMVAYGVVDVSAKSIGLEACEKLKQDGVSVFFDDHDVGEKDPLTRGMQSLSDTYSNTLDFVFELKRRLMGILSHNMLPSDELLVDNMPIRLGFSAGGT